MYYISFWHGMTANPLLRSSAEKQLIATLERMKYTVKVAEGEYEWHGTLDDFNAEYPASFMVGGMRINVSQHSNFT